MAVQVGGARGGVEQPQTLLDRPLCGISSPAIRGDGADSARRAAWLWGTPTAGTLMKLRREC